jgi:ankyrin repeat protein
MDQAKESKSARRFPWRAATLLALVALAGGSAIAWKSRRTADANRALILAIERGDANGVDRALALGADPDARAAPPDKSSGPGTGGRGFGSWDRSAPRGGTALMLSAGKQPYITTSLLKHGADPREIGCEHGRFDALMHAVREGSLENARRLLEAGADPNHHDQVGRSTLAMAASAGDVEAVKLLLDYNAQPNSEDFSGMSPLMAALLSAPARTRGACMEALLEHNANPEHAIHGMSLLMGAIQGGKADAVRVLLKYHANPNGGSQVAGRTPLSLAKEKGNKTIEALLVKSGAVNLESAKDANLTKTR